MDENGFTEVIVKSSADLTAIAAALGARSERLLRGYNILTIQEEKIPQLYAYAEVEAIELPKNLSVERAAFSAACIPPVQANEGYDLRGAGVIVAVIDYGIDYTHRDFRNADGTSRILYLWDQTIEGAPPAGFVGGTEYDRAAIDRALLAPNPFAVLPSVDTSGHGTAVAGIAAGGGRENPANVGAAPEAALIAVKLGRRGGRDFARTTELMRAVWYVIERARALLIPVAINISFGMNEGAHRGDSLFERYLSDAASEWKTVIVVPTGNEAASGHHAAVRLAEGQTQTVDFFVADGVTELYLSVWKDFADEVTAALQGPRGEEIVLSTQAQTLVFGDVSIRALPKGPTHYSVRQELFFHVAAGCGFVPSGLWRLRLTAGSVVNGSIELWLPTTEEVSQNTRFARPSEALTMTIPSTAEKVVSVAGYDSRTGSLAAFSGIGSEEASAPRPDLAAPAVSVVSTKSGGGYGVFDGTSFAAPFVTGAAALMMQWGIVEKNDPFLYGERLKAYLRRGAQRSVLRRYPNAAFGYGTLCLERTMEALTREQEVGSNG